MPNPSLITFPPSDPVLAPLARRTFFFTVPEEHDGDRLDRFLASRVELSRRRIKELIDFGSVWIEGQVCQRQARPLVVGERVTFQAPKYGPVRFFEADPERILFRDKWMLAYDKEAGIPCQQTPYDGYNHLYGALKRMIPGYLALHHRLDSPTSGVMLFSLHRHANRGLSRTFRLGPLDKVYLAMVRGRPDSDSFEVDLPISKQKGGYFCPADGSGKSALTRFTVLGSSGDFSLVSAQPATGRTHQIRLHLAAAGHPILGDPTYGGPTAPRLMLHARSITFHHPVADTLLTIEARPPAGFEVPPQ